MSEDRKGGGFWSLFRSKTKASDQDRHRPPRRRSRSGEGDYPYDDGRRRRRSEPRSPSPSSSPDVRSPGRRHSRLYEVKGKGPDPELLDRGGRSYRSRAAHASPRWPPSGVPSDEDLAPSLARDLIAKGAPDHVGHQRPVRHAPEQYYALYATTTGGRRGDSDAANLHDSMTQLMTMRTLGPGLASRPWDSLEQPSFAFRFGRRPGTVTLNHWASMSSVLPPTIALRDSGVSPRDADLELIMWRLQDLERGLEDDDETLMYKNLYRNLLRDPDGPKNPHRTLDRQITDLIMVLSRPDHWIDFTEPRNQVATRFIYDTKSGNHAQYVKFFHQLLLSCELDLRINSRHHHDQPRDQLLAQLPPTIQWGLALSRRWREYVRVDQYGDVASQVKLRFKLKRRQMKMLKRFAQMMKWPNLGDTLDNMEREDAKGRLCTAISSHAMAFFSGLVLPGPTFPFLIMNSLIDLDPDRATDDLALLTPVHPSCGFQYRNSYTYWSSLCVVGKVLAPTCHEVGGWVGPALPTSDLARTQIARIRTRRPPRTPPPQQPGTPPVGDGAQPPMPPTPDTPLTPQLRLQKNHRVLTPREVLAMKTVSDALGPPSNTNTYRPDEFRLCLPETYPFGRGEVVDTVRMELLTLRSVNMERRRGGAEAGRRGSTTGSGTADGNGSHNGSAASSAAPGVFDASLQFAIDGVSWPLRLSFDVDFVCAWPCSGGPHPLSLEFEYSSVPVDRVVEVRDWAGMFGGGAGGVHGRSTSSLEPLPLSPGGEKTVPGSRQASTTSVAQRRRLQALRPVAAVREPGNDDKVLVIEAFGVADNEVLARAWCAHFGISAVVADIHRTCLSCAIREAYAAKITVVILVDDRDDGE